MSARASGILLHPTCLPGPFGIGDLGPAAYRFADLLAETGQQYWQVLPVSPTDPDHGHSPYHAGCAYAGDPLWISPQLLVKDGWLADADLAGTPDFPADRVAFAQVRAFKRALLEKAFARFEASSDKSAVARFARQSPWLLRFALFRVLTERYGRPWSDWPPLLRGRRPAALRAAQRQHASALRREIFHQYLFFRQWYALKRHCNRRGVRIIGDMPIYLPFHSAEVWAHPQLYKLDAAGRPSVVSGVPPDYFSSTGQLWGHPVYDWDAHAKTGFRWWIRRTRHNLALFDRLRVDHFRGWVACWEVPAEAKTAAAGQWRPVPGEALLDALERRLAPLAIIAEDLGTITAEVRETMARHELPGMRVLQFAFGDDFPHGAFLPHNHVRRSVVYTGTHDNNTVRGWYASEAGEEGRERLRRYLGRAPDPDGVHWDLIRLALGSVADTAVIPLQDLLGLGAEARMNRPAHGEGNWRWRAPADPLPGAAAARLAEMTRVYGRAPR